MIFYCQVLEGEVLQGEVLEGEVLQGHANAYASTSPAGKTRGVLAPVLRQVSEGGSTASEEELPRIILLRQVLPRVVMYDSDPPWSSTMPASRTSSAQSSGSAR